MVAGLMELVNTAYRVSIHVPASATPVRRDDVGIPNLTVLVVEAGTVISEDPVDGYCRSEFSMLRSLRIRWLLESATYTFPAESTATPLGEVKLVFVPVPLADPGELPAKVVTTPSGVILRMR
jgi:hypothetical protein